MALVSAAGEARDARRAAEALRQRPVTDLLGDEAAVGDVRAAARRFDRAADRAGSPVAWPGRVLPVVGRQARSLRALSRSASEMLHAGADAIDVVGHAIEESGPSGPGRVRLARATRRASDSAWRRVRHLDLGPSDGLVGPLHDARVRLAEELNELQGALGRSRVISQRLVAFLEGPRRYLVLAVSNAEMQAGWGMPLHAGVLDVSDGALDLSGMTSTAELQLPPGAVALDEELDRHWKALVPSEEWRNLAVSPRFDVVAPLAARMWEARTGDEVDGVLAVDPFALAAILEGTGPVPLDERTIDADSAIRFALHDQYVGDPDTDERHDLLSDLAVAAVGALSERDVDEIALVRALADAAPDRHVLAWSRLEDEQRMWQAARLDGALGSDSVLVALVNRGANKLDWFVDVDAHLSLRRSAEGIDGRLEIDITNRTPPDEPAYVVGAANGAVVAGSGATEPGDYIGLLSVHLPRRAEVEGVEGVLDVITAGRDGPTQLLAANVVVRRDEALRAVVAFRLPPGGLLVVEPSARARPMGWSIGDVAWRDDGRRAFALTPSPS